MSGSFNITSCSEVGLTSGLYPTECGRRMGSTVSLSLSDREGDKPNPRLMPKIEFPSSHAYKDFAASFLTAFASGETLSP